MSNGRKTPSSQTPVPDSGGEEERAWMEVIRKMDETYEELVHQQVALEEKNAELEETQRFVESVLGSMSDLLIVCDVAGRIQRVNPALETMVGQSGDALAGRAFHELFAEPDQEGLRAFPQIIRNSAVTDCEVRLVDADGEWRPLAMNCTSRFDQRGRLVGMVLTARDVGELRRAYTELDQAHRELKEAQHRLVQSEKMASLGRLIAGVAHELNNPISFVYGNVHVMRRYADRLKRYIGAVDAGVGADERQRLREELRIDSVLEDLDPVLEGTLEGAQRVSDLVGELKSYSGGRRGDSERFNLAAVAQTAAQWIRKGGEAPVTVSVDLPEEIPVQGYSGQLHQLFVNLIQNAVDAAQEAASQAWVQVSGEVDAEVARIAVRDNGPGIDPGVGTELFEPFYSTKAPGQGTGLGLYIAYGIASEHGGSLEARNHEGGGAEFLLTLPVDQQ